MIAIKMMAFSSGIALALTFWNPAVANDQRDELKAMQGKWRCTTFQRSGESDQDMIGISVAIEKGRVVFSHDRLSDEDCRIEIEESDEGGEPGKLVWRQTWLKGLKIEIEFQGIYLLKGETLMICLPDNSSGPRPKYFGSSKEDQQSLMILQRQNE